MNITERIVSVKRHTLGFVIDNIEYTRRQAVKLAQEGKVSNARVVDNYYGPHLVGTNWSSLCHLPVRFGSVRRFASKRSK